ncbi:MAG TPA: restriction endonuclease subunit S [bacterium]|nr:restriction endonuclease subunit S [bacterium]
MNNGERLMKNEKKMNKIEKLIAELCPDGVEFKELGEVVNILDSQRRPVSKLKRTGGIYPYYGANGIQDYVDDYIFDGTFILLGEDGSVINKDGSPVLNWATGKIWVNNHAHVLAEKAEIAILRYVYFALSTIDVTKVVKGNIPKITQQNLRNFRIPIPPLTVQQEIVKILDTFTKLEAELEAELEARKKQYEYYRNKLLTFGDEVEFKDICTLIENEVVATVNPPKKLNKKHYSPIGTFPIIDQGQKFIVGYTDDRNAVVANGLYVIFGDHTELIKYVDFTFAQGADGIKVLTTKSDIINARYFYYVLNNFYEKKGKYTRHFSFLKKTKIPIPSLVEQERIVAILDKFDALVNDLTAGLPAELNARRKQYEYYRNKLLTFKPLEMQNAN